jgi:phosphatidylglycerol:prolipoprotein diacylglycerol transferase
VHPIAFQLGGLPPVYWYGILVALGFIVGMWTAGRRGVRSGLRPEQISDAAPWLLIGAMGGARILHVISYWQEEFAHKPFSEVFMVQKGGLVFYGGFIGAALATVLYTRLKKIPLWKFADAVAPSIALGHAFGRIGCLMTGCCFGKACSLPWAITFPPGHETHPMGEPGLPVHPTQIYESLLNFGLYVVLAWFYRRKKFDGQIFAMYLVCYAVLRSFVELFRADYKPGEYFFHGAVSPGQLVSIGIIAFGVALFYLLPKRSVAAK